MSRNIVLILHKILLCILYKILLTKYCKVLILGTSGFIYIQKSPSSSLSSGSERTQLDDISGVRGPDDGEVVSPSSPKKSLLPCLATNLPSEVSTWFINDSSEETSSPSLHPPPYLHAASRRSHHHRHHRRTTIAFSSPPSPSPHPPPPLYLHAASQRSHHR
jgi:hypothetical protein